MSMVEKVARLIARRGLNSMMERTGEHFTDKELQHAEDVMWEIYKADAIKMIELVTAAMAEPTMEMHMAGEELMAQVEVHNIQEVRKGAERKELYASDVHLAMLGVVRAEVEEIINNG